MNVRSEDVKGGERRVVRRWVSAGSSVEWGRGCWVGVEDRDRVGLEELEELSARRRGVNWRRGKTSVDAEALRSDVVDVVDGGAISGPSRASACKIYPDGSSSGDGPFEVLGQLIVYPACSFDGWTSKLILLTAACMLS